MGRYSRCRAVTRSSPTGGRSRRAFLAPRGTAPPGPGNGGHLEPRVAPGAIVVAPLAGSIPLSRTTTVLRRNSAEALLPPSGVALRHSWWGESRLGFAQAAGVPTAEDGGATPEQRGSAVATFRSRDCDAVGGESRAWASPKPREYPPSRTAVLRRNSAEALLPPSGVAIATQLVGRIALGLRPSRGSTHRRGRRCYAGTAQKRCRHLPESRLRRSWRREPRLGFAQAAGVPTVEDGGATPEQRGSAVATFRSRDCDAVGGESRAWASPKPREYPPPRTAVLRRNSAEALLPPSGVAIAAQLVGRAALGLRPSRGSTHRRGRRCYAGTAQKRCRHLPGLQVSRMGKPVQSKAAASRRSPRSVLP